MSERIKIQHVRRKYAVRGHSLISLDEIDQVTLHKRDCNEHGVYKPEVTIVLCNRESLYIGIYVALGEDGDYYTDYDVEFPTGGSSSWPSKRGIRSRTLKGALNMAINRLKEYRYYQGSSPDRRVVRVTEDALRQINSIKVRQMTIFDMIEYETL